MQMKRLATFSLALIVLVGPITAGCGFTALSTAASVPPTTVPLLRLDQPAGEQPPGTEIRYSNGWGSDWFQFGLQQGATHADTEQAAGIAVTSDGYGFLDNFDKNRSATVYGPPTEPWSTSSLSPSISS